MITRSLSSPKRLVFAVLLALFLAIPAAAAEVTNKCDSLRVSTLNMTEEQISSNFTYSSNEYIYKKPLL